MTSGGGHDRQLQLRCGKGGRNLAASQADSKFIEYGLDPVGQTRAETMWNSKTGTTRPYQVLAAFDPGGNRLTKFEDGSLVAYTYGESNELLTAGSDTFTIDEFLNMKTKVSGGNTTTYSWDFESNLIGIDFPSTANDDTHEYDGDSRRMRSKLAGAASWTNFVWDEVAGTLLAEYTLISGTYTIKSENTWGLGLISTNRESTKRYFHFDGMGNTVALTDGSENITDTYGYTSSGTSVAAEDSGTSVNPFRWRGQYGVYSDGAMGSPGTLVLTMSGYYAPDLALQPSAQIQRHTFPGYGNWCGPRHGPDDPVNDLDWCCFEHDWCLPDPKSWINPIKFRMCQAILCECAAGAKCAIFDFWCKWWRDAIMLWACSGKMIPFPTPFIWPS